MAKRILIVDDSAFIRKTLRNILTTNGYEVVGEAESGDEAIIKYKELHPDLVTMDVLMPGVSGLETLQALMILDRNANVLMITVEGKQSMVVESVQVGAKGFLAKPFSASAVLAEVQRILKD